METALSFIKFALSHAKPETLPAGAKFPVAPDLIGTDPWEYLYGTTGTKITKALLDERFEHYYSKKGWSREAYDKATEGFIGRTATDCEGLLDVFLKADVTAHYNYSVWCTEKGSVTEIDRPFEIGEAVFFQNSEGRITHVGFVCGFLGGDPLVVEARGIRYGVVITKFSERPWTHRGLITKKLDYTKPAAEPSYPDEPLSLIIGQTGEGVRYLQEALNWLGYTDENGVPLVVDGKLGKKTRQAVDKCIGLNRTPDKHEIIVEIDGCVVSKNVVTL